MKVKNSIIPFILFIIIFSPELGFCAEGGHHTEHTIGELWYHYVNFSIYALLMYLILKNPISSAWRKRRDTIAASLAKGTSILSDAKRELKEAEVRFASIASDSESIRKQMIKETEDEVLLIVQDAEKKASDIMRRGQESAASEQKLVERVIREELSQAVLKRAQELLSQKTSKESDRARRDASIKNIRQIVQ